MEKTAMTRYSDVFNTLKDHDNEISSPALVLPLAACSTKTPPPDAPQPPHAIGMANPASVYCLEKGESKSLYKARRAYVPSANCRAGK